MIVFQIPAELEDSEDHIDESTDDSELEDSDSDDDDDDLDDIQPFRPELGIYLPGPWEAEQKLSKNRFFFDLIVFPKLREFQGTEDVISRDAPLIKWHGWFITELCQHFSNQRWLFLFPKLNSFTYWFILKTIILRLNSTDMNLTSLS